MGLCPNEPGIHEPHFLKAFEFLETEGQELSTLQLSIDPDVGRVEVPIAALAEMERCLLGNAISNVNVVADAVDAHVGGIRGNDRST